jgi:hypothetical protein
MNTGNVPILELSSVPFVMLLHAALTSAPDSAPHACNQLEPNQFETSEASKSRTRNQVCNESALNLEPILDSVGD